MIKFIEESSVKQFNINGMHIVAKDAREAFQYIWMLNNPIEVHVNFGEDRIMKMQVQVQYQSSFLEDSIAIAIEDRLELIDIAYESFEVFDMNGNWLSSSEL